MAPDPDIQRDRPARHRNILFAGLAILAPVVFVLVLLEIGVRVLVDDGMRLDLEMWKYARDVKQVADNPRLGHRHRANASAQLMGVDVSTNAFNLRDAAISAEKPPGVLRILMLGDSLTFGWGVPVAATVSERLETMFNDSGKAAQVINAGVGNYNTVMEVEYFLTEGQALEPDIVVLNYFVNDAEPVPAYTDVGVLSRTSQAYVYLKSRLDVLFRQTAARADWATYYLDLYAGDAPGWVAAAAGIDALADYCRRHGIALLIANYPELRDLRTYRFATVQERVANAARRNGAAYVDLIEAVRGVEESRLWVTRLDPHPNAYAHQRFADALYPRLRAMADAIRRQ
jgi:lysophospholipase L1-like esterase